MPQGKGEDPIQRLIAVLDSGSTVNEAVKDAVAQLDSLGSLVVPHLLAALPKMGPFGITNTLDRLARFDDPRITSALANLIDTSDMAIAATVANRIPHMRRPVALPLAERIAQAKVEPKVQLGALRAMLQYDGAAATARQLAQRLAEDPSGEAQPALIESLAKAEVLALENPAGPRPPNDPRPFLVTAAVNAALRVAGASREKVVLEMLASPNVAVVQAALWTAGSRVSAELRNGMREAVLRVGDRIEIDANLFGQLDVDDRVGLAVAVLESERFAKFTPYLCDAALQTVGLRKDVRYLPQLVKGASHPYAHVRVEAAQAIGNTFAREAGPHLIEMLRDDRAEVRKAAQDALDQIANYLDARAKWEQRFK